MAVTKIGPLLRGTRSERKGFYVDHRTPVEIYKLTKDAGDTTYSLASNFYKAKTATVYDDQLALIAGATAVPSATAAGTIDLAVLGGGTEVFVVVEGFDKQAN